MSLHETCSGPESPTPCRGRSDGHALVGALAAGTFLLAATGALVLVASSEERTAAAFRDLAVTRYAAEAAAERMLLDLQFASSWDDVLSGVVRSSMAAGPEEWVLPAGRRLAIGPETAALDARLASSYPLGANTPRSQLFGWGSVDELAATALVPASDLYFAAWVSDEEGEADDDPDRDSNARVRVHALVISPRGARHELDVVVARLEPAPSPLRRLVWRGVLLD